MYLTTLFVLLSVAFVTAYWYVKRCYSFWAGQGVPFIEPRFPFGNLESTGRKEHFSLRMARSYNETKNNGSPITGMYFTLWPSALVTDMKFVQKVLIKDFHHFEDRGLYYNEKSDPLSAHLLNLEMARWKPLRSKLSPTFTSLRMKYMFPTILSVCKELIECVSNQLKNGSEIEIGDLLGRFTTDIIGTCAFGIECNSLKYPDTMFRQMGKKVFFEPKVNTIAQSLMFSNTNLARFLNLSLHHPDVTEFLFQMVKESIEYREKNNVQRKDFMDLLIHLKNDETKTKENRLTVKEIAAQAFVFFLAGFETSSAALTFALYELAQPHNKHIQDRAREEITTVLAKYDDQLTCEGLNEMLYVEQVVNETLRKYPSAPSLYRKVTKDYECAESKIKLRKGMTVVIPVYGIHHDPDIYDQPEEFRPERFMADEIKKRPNCSYLPFGDGPRNCIGMRFGILQVKVGLVTLLKQFRVSTCDRTTPIPMQFNSNNLLIFSPRDYVWLNFERV